MLYLVVGGLGFFLGFWAGFDLAITRFHARMSMAWQKLGKSCELHGKIHGDDVVAAFGLPQFWDK